PRRWRKCALRASAGTAAGRDAISTRSSRSCDMTDDPISFIDPEVQRCPFAAYAAVREQGPVYYDESCGYYIVTGYDEVRKWAGDTANLSNVTGLLLVKDAPYQPRIDAIYEEHGFLPVNTL